jgi:cytoskeletal protein CcmA (bactofilin family)
MNKDKINSVEVTILSKGVKLVGQIDTATDLLIEGEIHGPITSFGKVIVSKDGVIHGNVQAKSLELYGKCQGDVLVESYVVLGGSSFYKGSINCENIEIQKGSKFLGQLNSIEKFEKSFEANIESKILDINSFNKLSSVTTIEQKSEIKNSYMNEPVETESYQSYW